MSDTPILEPQQALADPTVCWFGGDFSALVIAAICAAFLVLVHWSVPRLRKLDLFDEGILNSIGGGLALGYVFLHALPSLIMQVSDLKDLAQTNFLNNERNLMFVMFLCVIAGFCVMYTLEKLAHDYTKQGREATGFIYGGHLGMLAYLSFSIALMMAVLAFDSLPSLYLFTAVMSFHFLLEDHAMTHHFPNRFNARGRYILMGAVVIGLILGVFAAEHHLTITVAFMNSFLIGALILSTTKTEFSLLEGRSHFPTFVTSLSVKAVVVFIMLLLENVG